jgi:uncharacterized protein (DUF934 family)
MPLLKDGRLADDPWIAVSGESPIPDGDPVIVDYDRWIEEKDQLAGRNAPLGVRLSSDQPPSLIADDLDRFSLVALEFPKFTDGRSYSHARLLRERYGFTGELRAVGNVLRDQFVFLERCGFDSFEVSNPDPEAAYGAAKAEITHRYQPATDR